MCVMSNEGIHILSDGGVIHSDVCLPRDVTQQLGVGSTELRAVDGVRSDWIRGGLGRLEAALPETLDDRCVTHACPRRMDPADGIEDVDAPAELGGGARLVHLALSAAMMPASHGWRRDVVFSGRNTILTLLACTSGWAAQLSTNRRTFLFCSFILPLSLSTHSLKSSRHQIYDF